MSGRSRRATCRCQSCGEQTVVTDSRVARDGSIRRRYACVGCGVRFTTYERIDPASFATTKGTPPQMKLPAPARAALARREISG